MQAKTPSKPLIYQIQTKNNQCQEEALKKKKVVTVHYVGSELLKLCLAKAAVPVMQVETTIYEQVQGLPKFKALPINKGGVLEKCEHYLFPDVQIKIP